MFQKYANNFENDCICEFICSGSEFMIFLRIVSSTRKGWKTLMCLIACAVEVYAIRVDYVRRLTIYLHVINGEVLPDLFLVAYSQILDSNIVSK